MKTVSAMPLLLRGLSPLMTRKDSLAWFVSRPAFPEDVKQLGNEQRIALLKKLKEVQCPRVEYSDLYLAVESAMRDAYSRRDPEAEAGRKLLYQPRRSIGDVCRMGGPINLYDGSNVLGLGITGAGKTRWALRMAQRHPACIDLDALSGGTVPHLQVPVLYVRCTSESTTRGMVTGFLNALEEATGDHRLMNSFRRAKYSTDEGAHIIAQLCRRHFIGVIIWDEFQDVVEANQRGARLMNNFLKYIRDTSGVPMVYVGGYSLWEAFSQDAALMRRSTTGGARWIDRFEDAKDTNWHAMVQMYWSHSVLRKPSEFTQDMAQHIFDRTQGVPDFLRSLMESAQRMAIKSGVETLTHAVIDAAFEDSLELHGPVSALESGNPAQLMLYKGLLNPAKTIPCVVRHGAPRGRPRGDASKRVAPPACAAAGMEARP